MTVKLGPGWGASHYQGGPGRDVEKMITATAAFRDAGGLSADGSLVFSQLLLNLAGELGREHVEKLIALFFDAADVPRGRAS